MERLSRTLKTAALAGLFSLGIMATSTAARADQVRVYCDRDGDTCTRVVCEDDGDDCKRTTFQNPNRYNRRNYWNNGYRNGYGGAYRPYGHWVCDSDGDRCHWATYGNEDDDDE